MQDQWGRTIEYVRVSLTDACNFACPYCRPEEITPEAVNNLLTVEEWMTILEAFHRLGVKAVRLTGGEPLLYPYLDQLLESIKDRGWFQDISMTTNASLLGMRAKHLQDLGLDRVNISLDSLDPVLFAQAVGKEGQMEAVLAGIEAAMEAGFKSVKINTVLVRAWSDQEVASLLAYIEKWPVIWRFIEYMPFQGDTFKGPSFEEWMDQLARVVGTPLEEVQGVGGFGPASYYRLPSGKIIGCIFSMSHSYCDSCNRLRLTADGKMRLCLLQDGEVDLIHRVRRGDSVKALMTFIEGSLGAKKEGHQGPSMDQPQRPMWKIGG